MCIFSFFFEDYSKRKGKDKRQAAQCVRHAGNMRF